MDIETITKLLDAGYTKEEIAKYESGAESAKTENEGGDDVLQGNADAGKEQGATGAENAGAVNGDVSEVLKTLTETVNGLTATVKAMQDANAKGAHTDNPKGTDAIKAAMDSFIEKL